MKRKNILSAGIIVGFALFSTYFGAGNLIFPPYIGVMSGDQWSWGILGMTISAIFLPIIAVIAVLNMGGSMEDIMKPLGRRFMQFFCFINYTFLALGSTIPRSAATTHEMGVQPLVGDFPIAITSLIFFAIFYFFARHKDSVVDHLGKYLTPALLILLLVIVAKVIVSPLGTPAPAQVEHPLVDALLDGYLTGDLTLGILVGGMFIASLKQEGFSGQELRQSTYIACLTAFTGLFIVYAGLAFGGAGLSSEFTLEAERTTLVIEIVQRSLGNFGLVLLSGAVALACLTTAVGIAANAATFLEELVNDRINYHTWIVVIAITGFVLSIQGVSGLLDYVTPLFDFLYPIFIVLTVLGLFDRYVPNDGVYRGAVAFAALFGLIDALVTVTNSNLLAQILNWMPGANYGFAWLIPALIGMVLGYIIDRNQPRATQLI